MKKDELIKRNEWSQLAGQFQSILKQVDENKDILGKLVAPDSLDEIDLFKSTLKSVSAKHKEIEASSKQIKDVLSTVSAKVMAPEKELKELIKLKRDLLTGVKKRIVDLADNKSDGLVELLAKSIATAFVASVVKDKLTAILAQATAEFYDGSLRVEKRDIGSVDDVVNITEQIERILKADCGNEEGLFVRVRQKIEGQMESLKHQVNTWYMEALELAVGSDQERRQILKLSLDDIQISKLVREIKSTMAEELMGQTSKQVLSEQQLELDKQLVGGLMDHLDQTGGQIPKYGDDLVYVTPTGEELLMALSIYLRHATNIDLADLSVRLQPELRFAHKLNPEGFSGIWREKINFTTFKAA